MTQAMIEFRPTRMGKCHAARLENSPRLQRVLALLQRGGRYSTRDIVIRAEVMAVNSAITELRANGIHVQSECVGRGRWEYWLEQSLFAGVER